MIQACPMTMYECLNYWIYNQLERNDANAQLVTRGIFSVTFLKMYSLQNYKEKSQRLFQYRYSSYRNLSIWHKCAGSHVFSFPAYRTSLSIRLIRLKCSNRHSMDCVFVLQRSSSNRVNALCLLSEIIGMICHCSRDGRYGGSQTTPHEVTTLWGQVCSSWGILHLKKNQRERNHKTGTCHAESYHRSSSNLLFKIVIIKCLFGT